VILSFERLKFFQHNCASVCVIHESACVVYALSMHDYGRDTGRLSVLMRLNRFETAHVHVRPLTPHLHITHEQRMYHVYSTYMRGTKVLVRGMCAKRAYLDVLRDSWVGLVLNVCGILHCISLYASTCAICRDSSVIVNDTCAVHA